MDMFFDAGMIYEAEVAQRYAVPTLDDLIAYSSTTEIAEEYANIKPNGAPINEAFRMGIKDAISDFPIFRGYTKFDVGQSRVMSLDLQDVAILGSSAARKQTSLMYMMARQCFMKKIAFSQEDLQFFPTKYQPHMKRVIKDIVDDYKVLCMDEYHKTGNDPALANQVFTDGREARKWNLEIILASQLMSDFGALNSIATTHFILDSGNVETRRWLKETIGLTPTEEAALVNYVQGAGPAGATFLARFETKSGKFAQLFTNTVGPMRMWALSTTAEDRKLRGLLYEKLPGNVARWLLAKRFPSGSCKKAVEKMKTELFAGQDFAEDEVAASVVERIAKEMLDQYFASQAQAA
jgi:intracellular multiplication protein IcmB